MLKALQSLLQKRIEETPGTYGVGIFHYETGESFYHLPDHRFIAASVIKVPIMCAVFDQAAKGALRLSDKIRIEYEDMVTGSGSLQYLSPGTELSIYDLVVLMIIESDNTATNLLIERVGTEAIQSAMAEWGLESSQFYNKLQVIPVNRTKFNVITARDMTLLMRKLADGGIVSWNACRHMVDILKRQRINDGLPSKLPFAEGPIGAIPAWELAHKTGSITGFEHDAGVLYVPGHTFAVAILGGDVTDRTAARELMGDIARLLFDAAKKKGVSE